MSQKQLVNPRDLYKNKKKATSLKCNKPLVLEVTEVNIDGVTEKTTQALKSGRRPLQEMRREVARTHSTADIETIMFNAIMREDIETVLRCLTDENIQIDQFNTNGFTALHLACDVGNLEIVNLLIDAGADLFIKSKTNNKSALQIANEIGHFEIAEFLISIGAQENEIKDGLST